MFHPQVFFVCLSTMLLCSMASEGSPASASDQPADAGQLKFFEDKVRPLLVDHCHACHGPKKQQSGLRVDSRDALLKGGDNGPAVVSGDPSNSLLIEAVLHTGDLVMPPPPAKKLPDDAIATLTAWVKMGAPWPAEAVSLPPAGPEAVAKARREHWAFRPLATASVPEVQATTWCQTPVDRFVLSGLERKGLQPSPPADRRTLIRRVTFNLIGLPPTPEETADFENDPSPGAYARVVDRLLASPHYGERWGRYWLDVARYADSKGYVFFQENNFPWSYTYRDYVVNAFNDDLPYDQFVLQQLAADCLPPGDDRRPLTALGFLTLGGRFMNNKHDIYDDRIDVVTRGLLGLTVTCARCHDHKFDPIPAADYYSLYGVFAGSVEPDVPPLFTAPPDTDEYKAFETELRSREAQLLEFVRTKQTELVTSSRTRASEYMLAVHSRRNQPRTDDFMLLADGGDLNPKMLLRWQNYIERASRKHHPVFSLWQTIAALPVEHDPEPASAGQAFAGRVQEIAEQALANPDPARPVNSIIARSLATAPPRSLTETAERFGQLLNEASSIWQAALAAATAAHEPPPARLPDAAQEELRQVFYGADAPPSVALNPLGDLDLLPDRPSQAKAQELRKAVETYRATGPGAPPRAMALVDAPTAFQPRIFLRGSPSNPGEAVPRQFLQVLAGEERRPFVKGSGRLELAQAIVDRQNPLTARVFVNRIWQHHFGNGLVRTPSDFGVRSDPPSHPELLDWLASTLMDRGWSIKALHRQILLSATFQQHSHDRTECLAVDPENRLLWKVNRRRLDFEGLRDALLAASGSLDRRLGGPPVNLFADPSPPRRTIYGFIDRLNLPGLFRAFDFPSPDATSAQRDITTVAPQALYLMNSPFAIQTAQKLMIRPEIAAEREFGPRIQRLYELLFSRLPTPQELQSAEEFFGDKTAREDPANWARYAQALLLTNEFAFVD